MSAAETAPPLVLLRFCGRTWSSSAAAPLLAELSAAIASAFGQATPAGRGAMLRLTEAGSMFAGALALATVERPVLVIIDDADVLRDGAELGSILPLSLPPFCSVIVSAREEGYFAGMRAKMRAKGRSAFVATFVLLQLFGLCSKRCMLQHGVLRCKLAHCVALRCTISTVLYHVGRCTVLQ
jgi:hypothetical protein